jgi:acetaldehyde dehydrogenase/alcohol dehydrogenase
MEPKVYPIIDSVETLKEALERVRAAQKLFSTYTQEQVDRIFRAAAAAADQARVPLAKLAVEETGMGVVEDKILKNHLAAEYIYNAYKNTKTCGVIEEDRAFGVRRIAEPIGVVGAVIPTTNPTSTAIYKCLIALKTRNGVLINSFCHAWSGTPSYFIRKYMDR